MSCARLIARRLVSAVHDVSDGGLLVALAEMAMASGIGAALDAAPDDTPAHAFWFGEDQARYVVTVPARARRGGDAARAGASVPVHRIGTTGGDALSFRASAPSPSTTLRERFEGWLPAYMAAPA